MAKYDVFISYRRQCGCDTEKHPLVEELTKNVHEVFVQNRMKEGWKYGPVRDDAKKENPTMVPYEELPESEKDYDRATSQETLKFILSKGFHISKN